MASPHTWEAADPEAAAARGRQIQRRRPSPAEHARRVAWGRKWGALVRDAYKAAEQKEGTR